MLRATNLFFLILLMTVLLIPSILSLVIWITTYNFTSDGFIADDIFPLLSEIKIPPSSFYDYAERLTPAFGAALSAICFLPTQDKTLSNWGYLLLFIIVTSLVLSFIFTLFNDAAKITSGTTYGLSAAKNFLDINFYVLENSTIYLATLTGVKIHQRNISQAAPPALGGQRKMRPS